MGKRGVAILLVIIVALAVQALRVHSACPPSCGTCLNGILDPGEVCDRTATPSGCPASYTCSADCTLCSDSQGHTCNNNGVCGVGEVYPCDNCPAPCTPSCVGKSCGPDTCGGQCPPGCSAQQVCLPSTGQCCTPTTCSVNSATTPCNQTATGTDNCGQPCTVTGTQNRYQVRRS